MLKSNKILTGKSGKSLGTISMVLYLSLLPYFLISQDDALKLEEEVVALNILGGLLLNVLVSEYSANFTVNPN